MGNNVPKYLNTFKNNKIEKIIQNFGENASIKFKESIDKPNFFNMIEPISSFTGREKELYSINESVLKNMVTAVCGFGGIGKTELVRFYTWQHKTNFDGNVVWINAESESSLENLFKKLAAELFVSIQHNGAERLMSQIIRDIYFKLNKNKCLIVFDNACKKGDIKAYLPQKNDTNVSVLITSQNQDWGTASLIALSVLSAEDAYEFLATNLKESCNIEENKQDIKKLAKELEYLPLALQQAVAYINYKMLNLNEKFSVIKYIEEFEKKKILNFTFEENFPFPDSSENSYDKTLFRSVELSVDLLEKSSPYPDLTLDILHVCSYLSPNNIPRSIFNTMEEEEALNTSLHILTKYSLLQKFKNKDQWEYNIHRLVQLSYRYIKNPEGFCQETVKKTILLTTKNISSNVYHFIYVLDLIMKDEKHGCEFYFDDETIEEIFSFKFIYYDSLKTLSLMLENYVKFYQLVHLEGKENVYYKKLLKEYRDFAENFILNELEIQTDFFENPTYEVAEKLHKKIIEILYQDNFDEMEQIITESIEDESSLALLSASLLGHLKILQYFKQKGFNINFITFDKVSPLFLAAQNIQCFLVDEHHYDVNMTSNDITSPKIAPLFLAAANGHKDIVKFFVENKCDLNICTKAGGTPLFAASAEGHLEIVRYLIENGADLNKFDKDSWSPLHAASAWGHMDIVRLLVDEHNCDVNMTLNDMTSRKVAPLHLAASNGHKDIVKFFVEKRCDLNICDKTGQTPLFAASAMGHLEIVRYLIENEADLNMIEKDSWAPLHAASSKGHLDIVRLLVDEHHCDVNMTSNDTTPPKVAPLFLAASNGHKDIVKFLVECKCDINICDKTGKTPLFAASVNGHLEIVRYLLENGADLNKFDEDSFTPLHAASEEGHMDIVRLLVDEHHCDVNVTSNDMTSHKVAPLHLAAFNGHKDIVKFLVEKRCDLNICDITGKTPLFAASAMGHLEIVRYLIESGADLNKFDKDSWSTLHAASVEGHMDIVRLLVDEHHCDVNMTSKDKSSALFFAAEKGHFKIVEYLKEKGANVNQATIEGITPLDVAAKYGYEDIVQLLNQNESVT